MMNGNSSDYTNGTTNGNGRVTDIMAMRMPMLIGMMMLTEMVMLVEMKTILAMQPSLYNVNGNVYCVATGNGDV